jgi:hypothetical protein
MSERTIGDVTNAASLESLFLALAPFSVRSRPITADVQRRGKRGESQ